MIYTDILLALTLSNIYKLKAKTQISKRRGSGVDDTHLVMIATNLGGIGVYISLSLVEAVCNEYIKPSILISIFLYSLISGTTEGI